MTTPARAGAAAATEEPPLVSVVIANWNGLGYLPDCLASLARQTWPRLEIVVVDNGSTDGSLAFLRGVDRARLAVIEAGRNLGFAGGNNLGIRAARGAFVALLNNDAVAEPGWVAALARAAADPRVGMCASKILVDGRPGVLDGAGLLLSADGIGRGRGRLEFDGPAFGRAEDVLLPSGCAALYRRAMLDEVGLFDEDFFAYCEDTDLGLRARMAGWRCRYVPDAVVRHRYSASTAPYSAFKAFQVERNHVWVVAKCFPPRLALLAVACTPARWALQAWGALRGRGAAARMAEDGSLPVMLAVLVRAWLAALAGLPRMLRRRRQVQARRRISAAELTALLRAHRLGLRALALQD